MADGIVLEFCEGGNLEDPSHNNRLWDIDPGSL